MAITSSSLVIKLPDGREASFEDMQSYGFILQEFIREQEALLPLVEDTRRHNEIIDYLQLLASAYNVQLRIYKAREAQQQRLLGVALIGVVNNSM
jgi:hypothetical protein